MRSGILRFAVDGRVTGDVIFAEGTHLALAVAASSCFPPIFHRLKLNYNALGVRYDEFDGKLLLRDGGVAGNLGVEVLMYLMRRNDIGLRVLACDAETGLATEPLDTPLAVINVQGLYLFGSCTTNRRAVGSDAITLSFKSTEATARFGSSHPNQALVLPHRPGSAHVVGVLRFVVSRAPPLRPRHCPSDFRNPRLRTKFMAPSNNSSRRPVVRRSCLNRRKRRSGVADGDPIGVLPDICSPPSRSRSSSGAGLSEAIAFANPRWNIRPLGPFGDESCRSRLLSGTSTRLVREVAVAVCRNDFVAVRNKYLDGVSQFELVVAEDSSDSIVYARKTVRPAECEHDVECEVVFRGAFEPGPPFPARPSPLSGGLLKSKPTQSGGTAT